MDSKLKPASRRNKLSNLVKYRGSVSIQEVTNILKVSKITIYRDIKSLKNLFITNGLITFKNTDILHEFPYFTRRNKNKELKIAIARAAINYINDNDTIFLDGSSTVGYLANEIVKKNFNLTVVTISPIISIELAKSNNIKIHCLGGLLDNINFIYCCKISDFLTTININKAFISCGAFSIEMGFTDLSVGESDIKREIVNKIPEVNILADHTKINKTFSYTWSNFDDITRLICDSLICENDFNNLKSKKPDIVLGDANFLSI